MSVAVFAANLVMLALHLGSVGVGLYYAPHSWFIYLPMWAAFIFHDEYTLHLYAQEVPYDMHYMIVFIRFLRRGPRYLIFRFWRHRWWRNFSPRIGDVVCDDRYKHHEVVDRAGDTLIFADRHSCSLRRGCDPADHKWKHPGERRARRELRLVDTLSRVAVKARGRKGMRRMWYAARLRWILRRLGRPPL